MDFVVLLSEGDTTFREVIWCELDRDGISWYNPYEMFLHLA